MTFRTWDLLPTEDLSFQDIVEIFESRGPNPVSGYDLDESAQILTNLYKNRESVFQHIVDNLDNIISNGINANGPTAFYLHRSKHFVIRMVAWTPTIFQGSDYSSLVSDVIHDHNFCFLTLGLLGPGYETEIWQYPEKLTQKLSDKPLVKVNYEGFHSLASGRVFFYDNNFDIHRQLRPEELSLSFNIMEGTNLSEMQYKFVKTDDGLNDYLINTNQIVKTLTESLKDIIEDSPLEAFF